MVKLSFSVLTLTVLCITLCHAKPHHLHKKHSRHQKNKRDTQQTASQHKKSDIGYDNEEFSLPSNNYGPGSNADDREQFTDNDQANSPLSPAEDREEMVQASAHFSKVGPHELDAAYKFVNDGQFDQGQKNYENPPPGSQRDVSSSLFSARSDIKDSFSNYGNNYGGGPYDYQQSRTFSEPVEELNPNEIEKSVNLGDVSGTTNYNPDASRNNVNDLGEAGFPEEEESKKSGVPRSQAGNDHIPSNASHPAGDHTHLTENAVISHTDNQPNYTAVSRYPPYITADGKSVSGPPPNGTNPKKTPINYAASTGNSGQSPYVPYPHPQTTYGYSPYLTNAQPQSPYGYSPYSSNLKSSSATYPYPAQQPVTQRNTTQLNAEDPMKALGKMIPDITQLASPASDIGPMPILKLPQASNKTDQPGRPKTEEVRFAVDPMPGKSVSPTESESTMLAYPHDAVVARVGSGVETLPGNRPKPTQNRITPPASQYPVTLINLDQTLQKEQGKAANQNRIIPPASQYPVTLINLDQTLQKEQRKAANQNTSTHTQQSKQNTSTQTPQVKNGTGVSDDPRCKSYTVDICYQQWMQRHCPLMCSKSVPASPNTVQTSKLAPETLPQKLLRNSKTPAILPMKTADAVKPPMVNMSAAINTTTALKPGSTLVQGSLAVEGPKNATCSYNGGVYKIGEGFDKNPCSTCLCEDEGINCYDKPNCKQSQKFQGSCQLPSYGGNANGGCCVFPFIYNGQPQYSCVLQPGQGYWCGTTVNVDTDKQWGQCGSCIQPPCPSATPSPTKPTTTTTSTTASTTSAPATPSPTKPTTTTTSTTASTTSAPECETWGKWTECDVTCGGGHETRYRHCRKNGGVAYLEEDKQECNTKPCPPPPTIPPVRCEAWTDWSECSKTCGFGDRIRTMTCQIGNKEKVHNETKQCYIKDCPLVCDPWGEYSECSKTCGGGVQSHKRNCSFTDNIHTDIFEVSESHLCNNNPCPTEWSEWSEWSDCTVSCGGGGIQSRWRMGTWEDLGRTISVPQYQTQPCGTEKCEVCEEWSEWTECTKTCDGGKQERYRKCENRGHGTYTEKDTRECNNISCIPPYCGPWSAFTECTASCDGGIKERWRTCGGVYDEENVTCNEFPCSKPPDHTEWSNWSECSVSCGGGSQWRWRNITVYYNISKSYTAPEYESRSCNMQACVSNETVCTDWAAWSECSATCNGMQTRVHHCKNATYEADELQARPCNTQPCPIPSTPAPCTEWSQWSECTRSCGGGYQERYRTCQGLQQEIESRACNTQSCIPIPPPVTIPVPECIVAYLSFDSIDVNNKIIFDEGPFQNHASYTGGNVDFPHGNFSCGNAINIKDGEVFFNGSTVQNIPKYGFTIALWVHVDSLLHRQSLFSTKASGSNGDNFHVELEAGKVVWYYSDVTGRNAFTVVSDAVIDTKDWFHLVVTYNASTSVAQVYINARKVGISQGSVDSLPNWDQHAGFASPVFNERFQGLLDEVYIYNCSLTEEQVHEVADTCRTNIGDGCPSPLLGVCPPCHPNCSLTTTASPATTTEIPPINGGYGQWSEWSLCSVSCETGINTRTRECDNPEPKFGGLECIDQPELGNDTDTKSCYERHCPIDGKWCQWSNWTECNVLCDWGLKSRSRECNCGAPQHGGRQCIGSRTEQTECFLKGCPKDGNYSSWSPWSPCSVTCGNGTRISYRSCTDPAPSNGGRDCQHLGPAENVTECFNINECPEDGQWSPWSPWSTCSRSCGNGAQTRNRTCSNPAPSNGGNGCPGNATEALFCKIADCCEIPYKSLGCFRDPGQEPHPLPDLLFTDRDPQSNAYTGNAVHGLDFQGYITDLICRCARETKNKKFTHFSIQDFGECLSGPQVASTYNKYGAEMGFAFRPQSHPWLGCMDIDHDNCEPGSLTCVGMEDTNYVYGLGDVVPIDGNYTDWSPWSTCSASCGIGQQIGQQYRTRACTNPKPSFGGNNCSHLGPNEETEICQVNCPGPGYWGAWSNFTECSVTCGGGMRWRARACNSPPPTFGGLQCVGNSTQTETCETQPCPVNCSWSDWSLWSECDVTCEEGKQMRSRTSDKPRASNGGHECTGVPEEIRTCENPTPCPIDGFYTVWSNWTACSKTCGDGVKYRYRNCTNPEPKYSGRDCTRLGLSIDEKSCESCCPVHGGLSEWTDWGGCDVTCGIGEQIRTRKCDFPPASCGGRDCTEETTEVGTCSATINCPIDGNWTVWSGWSECSKSCGFGGIEQRQRTCTNPAPMYNGRFCYGDDTEIRNCSIERSCCTMPYTPLGCYKDESSALTSRTLPELLFDETENIDLGNWDDVLDDLVCKCASAAKELKYTHFALQSLGQCYSGPEKDTFDKYGPGDNCVTTGGNPSQYQFQPCASTGRPCAGGQGTNYVYGLDVEPINGNYTEWSPWSNCSVSCGHGSKNRYRTCTNPSPAFGGKTCGQQPNFGNPEEGNSCFLRDCPIDCNYSEWSAWGACSHTCGIGMQERIRTPNPAAANGGQNCSGAGQQERQCNPVVPCPVNCNYTEWSEWSTYSKTCENATRTRTRTQNPPASNGGRSCEGSSVDTETTNLGDCPVHGGWCAWDPWSTCSRTCGLGNTNRTRVCQCPAPENGGRNCKGPKEECKECNITGCPVNGHYSHWTSWTNCDHTCGNGTKSRSRSCSSPAPAFGGLSCGQQDLGNAVEFLPCNIPECPVHGNWSPWSQWTSCSLSCGEGRRTREHQCNNPPPNAAGDSCVGNATEVQFCKLGECCATEHKAVGCYQDMQFEKVFSEMLSTRTESLTFLSWEEILSTLICECAKYAKDKQYTHFGISKYAECWSGPDAKNTYGIHGPSNQCISMVPIYNPKEGNPSTTNMTIYDFPRPTPLIYELCPTGSLQCAGPVGSLYVYSLENVTTVDGGYSEWSSWSQCSHSCGGGIHTAMRTCNTPYPSFDGRDCSNLGEAVKTEPCNDFACAVNGSWSDWSTWSYCSVTCGVGIIERIRTCSNPEPSNGGILCNTGPNGTFEKNQRETGVCNMPACPVQTGFDPFPWSDWSPCSVTCDHGEKHRERNCSQSYSNDRPCPCPRVEYQECILPNCPVTGNWGPWSEYSLCSTTCGAGVQNRTRNCDHPAPSNGGATCEGYKAESRQCPHNPLCPVNGNYTPWSDWSECDQTCNGGQRMKTRSCSNPVPQNGGLSCVAQNLGNATGIEVCNTDPCPENCVFSNWTEWSSCSVSCGNGIQTRYRQADPPAKYNGTDCVGDYNQTKSCYINCCETNYQRLGCFQAQSDGAIPNLPQMLFNYSAEAHATYSDWNDYLLDLVCRCAEAAKSMKFSLFALQDLGVCVSGVGTENTYNKSGPSSNCVSKVSDPPSDKNNSYLQCQAEDKQCAGADDKTNFVYSLTNVKPVDCGYTQWSSWTPCSKTCGLGTQDRNRFDNNPAPEFGGKLCVNDTDQTQQCLLINCPVPGNWGNWSSWTACSPACGDGIQSRSRECNNPPAMYDGPGCKGNSTKSGYCTNGPCPVNGNWSEWGNWSSCTVTCGGGSKQRNRTCSNPPPQFGGMSCPNNGTEQGGSTEQIGCNNQSCLCEPTAWGSWSSCSVTCESGFRSRSRECPCVQCAGDLVEYEACQKPSCPGNCTRDTDLGFLVDFSGTKGSQFDKIKQFIIETSLKFDIAAEKTHFAYLPYSTVPDDTNPMYWFRDDVIGSISSGDKTEQKSYLEYIIQPEQQSSQGIKKGKSFLNRGLGAVADQMFAAENGMRVDVKNVLLLISDGHQEDMTNVENPYGSGKPERTIKEAADAVKAKGVEIVAVGVGDDINFANLIEVVSDQSFILNVSSYDGIGSTMAEVIRIACEPQPHWGSWGNWTSCSVSCGDGVRERVRTCEGGTIGTGLCTPASAANQEEACNNGPCMKTCDEITDLGFLIDLSNSMKQHTAPIKEFIVETALLFDIANDKSHFSWLPFNNNVSQIANGNNYFANSRIGSIPSGNKVEQRNYLNEVVTLDNYVQGRSFINRGLEGASNIMFTAEKGMRANAKHVLVVISDGKQSDLTWLPDDTPLKIAADAVKNKGIKVIAVAGGDNIEEQNLKDIASDESYIMRLKDYSEIKTLIETVANISCAVQAHWGEWESWSLCSVTCGNGTRVRHRPCVGGNIGQGACTPEANGSDQEICSATPCIEKCNAIIDLGFIVDYSGSTGDFTNEEHQQAVKEFIKDTAAAFELSASGTHFSYIPFSTLAGDYSPDQWFNNSKVASMVPGDIAAQTRYLDDVIQIDKGNETFERGRSYIDRALDLAKANMFSTDYGMRPDKKQILILITDAAVKQNSHIKAKASLNELKRKGLDVFAVAIGKNAKINWGNLAEYVSKPDHLFNFTHPSMIKAKMADINAKLCADGTTNFIGSDTTPTTTTTTQTTTITTSPTTTVAVPTGPYHCSRVIDIVLLVDGSSSITPHWSQVQTFLKNVVSRFDVTLEGAYFSIVLYSSSAKTVLELTGEGTDFIDFTIDTTDPLEGSTRIDIALDYVFSNVLTPGHGDREEVTDVVVLLTDGKTDAVSKDLGETARPLKEHGVYIIAVGLGNDTSFDELQKVASTREAVYVMDDYAKIAGHIDTLVEGICDGSVSIQNYGSKEQHNGYLCEPTIFYSFDVTCDSTVYDESRRGNDGTASGQHEIDETTKKCKQKLMISEGGSLQLNGNNIRGKPVDGLTIAVWLNLYGDGKIHPVFSVVNSKGQGQYLLEVRPQGNIHFSLKFGEIVVCEMTTSDNIFVFNEWNHVALTYSMADSKGIIYINGNKLDSSKIPTVANRESELLAGDWAGYVAIGKERLNSTDKQLMGSVDEFYLFPCVLDIQDVRRVKEFCDRYEPRIRSYAGTRYELFARPSSTSASDLRTELENKQPVLTETLDLFEAPVFDSIESAMTSIGTGLFAARLSGYFVPPISADYTLKFEANEQGALFMNAAKPSLTSEVTSQATLMGPTDKTFSREYKTPLKAGVRYYIELYQLSSEKMNTLKLGFNVQCEARRSVSAESPITKINAVYDIPRNCSEIHNHIINPPDDMYTLRLHSKCDTVDVYCHNMAVRDVKVGSLEYLTLEGGAEENYALYHRSRLVNFNTCSGSENPNPSETEKFWGQTWFKRVRVNPSNMLVTRDDYTFAYSVGNRVKYGTAGDCYSKSKEDCRKGQFKINLNGTGMKVVGSPKWVATGYPKDLNERITRFSNSNDWKRISSHCGGSCSECEPEEGHIRLEPDICVTEKSDATSSVISRNKETKKRQKRSIWNWWPW